MTYSCASLLGPGVPSLLTWIVPLALPRRRSHAAVPGQTDGDGPCTGTTTPVSDCPYNFFRTSGDISNNWNSMFNNLQTTIKYQGDPPLARPGTWA